MVSYSTDEEQVEALKNWWKENGKSTMLSVALAVAAVFSWQGWQKHQQATMEAASAQYQNLLSIGAADFSQLSEEQKATVMHLSAQIKADYPGLAYAQFAAFYRAKMAVYNQDLSTAEQELRWVLERAASDEIRLQALLRLARVQFADQRLDEALATIPADTASYSAAFEELRGDIYLARGEKSAAALAYKKSAELLSQGSVASPNPLLQLKIQTLDSDMAVAAPAAGEA